MHAFLQMDVFTATPLHGNGLAVVLDAMDLSPETMLAITREFNQFETIFLGIPQDGVVEARIYTTEGPVTFAGHPVLGAAVALANANGQSNVVDTFDLGEIRVPVAVSGQHAILRQVAEKAQAVPTHAWETIAIAHGISLFDLDPDIPMAVLSIGLPHLCIFVRDALHRIRIQEDLTPVIAPWGAQYTYLVDWQRREARGFDNRGMQEDYATGSAAGPVISYLQDLGKIAPEEHVTLSQGTYANRPSQIEAWVKAGLVFIAGDAVIFSRGMIGI